ncbi:MAG: class I SAM-dependent methyltransferase, partial [Planctomycetota bacterium]
MTDFDQAKAEAFAGTMVGMLNGGMLSLMTSIGYETGLFDVMADLPASTSEEIASAAGLNERYVREWLGAMVTGGIIERNCDGGTHVLPPEHATAVTSAAGPDNLALFAGVMTIQAKLQDRLVDCFRNGGGVGYDENSEVLDHFSIYTNQIFDRSLVSQVIPLMPDVEAALKDGAAVLDIGCGAGHSTNVMAKAFPASRFTGFEFREDAVEQARAQAKSMGLSNADFRAENLTTLDEVDAYNLVTAFDVIHDQARPRKVLRNVLSALKPNGTFLMVDIKASSDVCENIQHPMAPFMYTISATHCMTVSLADGGEGLGAMWGEQKALELLEEAG